MFATDGEMLHCPAKSVLMSILEKLPAKTDDCRAVSQDATSQGERMQVCIVDAMAEVQSLDKPDWIKSCSQLAASLRSMETMTKYASSLIATISRPP